MSCLCKSPSDCKWKLVRDGGGTGSADNHLFAMCKGDRGAKARKGLLAIVEDQPLDYDPKPGAVGGQPVGNVSSKHPVGDYFAEELDNRFKASWLSKLPGLKKGCKACKELQQQMNTGGVQFAKSNRKALIEQVVVNASKIHKVIPALVVSQYTDTDEFRELANEALSAAIERASHVPKPNLQPHSPREPFDKIDEHAHFVWIYWQGGAEANEILWSIRSVEANYAGTASITVIGDRPPGFEGHVIEQKRVKQQPFRRFRDTLAKMRTLASTPELPDEVIWCMDDCYFLKQGFTRADVDEPKKNKRISYKGRGEWSQMQQATDRALQMANLPKVQYTTHLPQVVNRERLRHVFATFDFSATPLCWESLYGNLYHRDADTHAATLHRITKKQVTAADCELVKASKVVLNHHHGSWSPALAEWLKQEFDPA